ncbi:MAG: aquaporin [Thermoplasmata archaeon]|nr:aquaporin [Thermoplasmata archaeon]
MTSAVWQRYLAEFVGTFGLLLFGGGAAVTTLGALVFEPYARIGVVSLTFGLVLIGLVYAFGDLSGAHFNPAVTISLALSGRMPRGDVVPYLVSQVLGAIVGIGVVAGIASGSPSLYPLAQAAALGSQCYAGSGAPAGCTFSLGAVFVTEVALAFVFVLTIQLVTRSVSSAKNLAPLAIGFTLLATNLMAIPIDGASLNPVRSFAPALLSLVWPSDHWAIAESWVFWVAPILGGVLASFVERALRPVPVNGPA